MDYSGLSWDQLRALRASYPDTSPMQAQIAPYEHQAFAREQTERNPLAAAGLAVGIPGYALAKLLGVQHGRTPASWDEVAGGYRGIGQGLASLFARGK